MNISLLTCTSTNILILFSVASRVLQHDKLMLEGNLLKIVEKLFLPFDKKQLYVENIDPKTSKDCLTNYIEVLTKKGVCNVQFGGDRNALIDLEEEPGTINVSINVLKY